MIRTAAIIITNIAAIAITIHIIIFSSSIFLFATVGAISFELSVISRAEISAVSDSERVSDEAANDGTADRENSKAEANIIATILLNIKNNLSLATELYVKLYKEFKANILKHNEQKEKNCKLFAL